MSKLLSECTKILSCITPAAGVAGTADINGSTVDMAGYDGLLMIFRFGVITVTAVTSVKAQQGDASNLSDASDLEGSAQTVADDDDNGVFYIDLFRPAKRYVRGVVDRGTANAVVSAEYLQYRARNIPTSHGAAVAGESHVSPAEGTA